MVECIKHEEDVSDRGKPGENPARYRHCVSVLPISQNTDREACVRKRRVTASATRRARAPSACLRSEYGLRGPRQTRGRAAFVLLSFFCEANVRKEKEDSERTCKHACGDSAAGLGPLAGRRALPGPRARCSLGCRRSDCCSGGGKRSSVRRYGHADRHRRQQERLRHGRGHVPHMGQQAVRPRRGAEDGPGRGRHRTRQGRSHDGGPAGHRRGEGRPQGLRRLGVLVRQVPQLRDLEGRREAGRLEQRRLFSRPILVPVRQRRLCELFVRPGQACRREFLPILLGFVFFGDRSVRLESVLREESCRPGEGRRWLADFRGCDPDGHLREQDRLRCGGDDVPGVGQQAVCTRRGAQGGPSRRRHRACEGGSHDGGPPERSRGEGRSERL